MTSSIITGQPATEGRSVRDIVEHAHDEVNEAWCRKIFRQLLQSLERQYAMDMPHRAITADTVVFHQNGEPLLLPSIVSDPAPAQADDLTALARLVHYAITQELMPDGPLHGRALDGYSDSLKNAVDRCMDPDPARRPQTIAELRDILGIVAPGSAPLAPAPALLSDPVPAPAAAPVPAPASVPPSAVEPPPAPAPSNPAPAHSLRASADSTPATAPTPAPAPAAQRDPASPAPGKRWPVAAGVAIAVALLAAGFAAWRDNGSAGDEQAAMQAESAIQPPADAQAPASPPPAPAADAAVATLPDQPAAAPDTGPTAPMAPAPGTLAPPASNAGPAPTAPAANVAANPAANSARNAYATANPAGASYKLQIQPWGTVYVDGVDRGVSPPVKRLLLSPGRHTIRVTNPNFLERVLEIDTANGDGRIAIDFSDNE